MIKSIEVNSIVNELNLYKRPKATESLYISGLGERFYTNVPRVKALFKLLKAQKIGEVLIDYERSDQVTIVFNGGTSEYVLFNEKDSR